MEEEDGAGLLIEGAPPPRPLLPPTAHPLLLQLLLASHLLVTPIARLLALAATIHQRTALALFFLPPTNVTELAGTSECDQLTVVVEDHPALFNRWTSSIWKKTFLTDKKYRKYRTYVEDGGDRQLHCSTGSCQEMKIFDSEKDIREWDR